MKLDRRAVLGGAAAVAGATLLSGAALAEVWPPIVETMPDMAHSLSPMFSPTVGWTIHPRLEVKDPLRPDAVQRVVSIEILRTDPDQLVQVSSVEDAEDAYLGRLGKPDTIFRPRDCSPHPIYFRDAYAALAILINRQANQIAVRTRRGAGNVVLGHPRAFEIMAEASIASFASRCQDSAKDPLQIGLWEHVGYLNASLTLWKNERMPTDRVYVLYNGNQGLIDSPGGLVYSSTGRLMHLPQDTINHAGVIGIEL